MSAAVAETPTADDVRVAAERIRPFVHRTPIMTSESIDRLAGCQVFFKCEHLQKTGSFKARGASNFVQKLKEDGDLRGVITHSSGNHGQGLSFAARAAGLPCTVVVPKNAPLSKLEGMRAYAAELVLCEPTMQSRTETCERLSKERGLSVVPPFDHPLVVAGQGTVAVELLEQVPDLDAVLLAVGGGGLSAGTAVFAAQATPPVQVILAEPEGKGLQAYLEGGHCRTDLDSLPTVADGIRVLRVGSTPLPLLKKHCVGNIVTVSEEEIKEAVALIWTRLKQRVEPTAGVPLAALLKMGRQEGFALKGRRVCVVLCGGNCDVDFVPV